MAVSAAPSSTDTRFGTFLTTLARLGLLYLVGLALLMTARTALLWAFGDGAALAPYRADLARAYAVGWRFDTLVLAYTLLLPVAAALVLLAVPLRHARARRRVEAGARWFAWFGLLVLTLLSIIDFFFFKFFQTHLSLLAFGLLDDDTRAVLRSVWTDYPVVRGAGALIVIGWALARLTRRIGRVRVRRTVRPVAGQVAVVLSVVGLLVLALRGSVGTFPLRRDDASVSTNTFVNALATNGVFALRDAVADRRETTISLDLAGMLRQHGFASGAAAVSAYLGQAITTDTAARRALLAHTPPDTALARRPPHVVVVQMESMSNYYFDLHQPAAGFDLLGALAAERRHCYVFRNFLPGRNGTIHSLEGLLVSTPFTPLSQSAYLTHECSGAVARPFGRAGYQTHFLTGARLGWRNLDKWVGYQGFADLQGDAAIRAHVPHTEASEWGVYDEFLFERMWQQLGEGQAAGRPQFIYAMTISNHTPYQIPTTYAAPTLQLPPAMRGHLRVADDLALLNFRNYRYANHCLGRFLARLRASPLGQNTIVVATGDHNTFQNFDFDDAQQWQHYTVPLVLYVPPAYRPAHPVDTTRFGSHKDIFPTVFHRALAGATYLRTGQDLLRPPGTPDPGDFALNDYHLAMTDSGAVVPAPGTLLGFQWETDAALNVPGLPGQPARPRRLRPVAPTPALRTLADRARAYAAALSFYLQAELLDAK